MLYCWVNWQCDIFGTTPAVHICMMLLIRHDFAIFVWKCHKTITSQPLCRSQAYCYTELAVSFIAVAKVIANTHVICRRRDDLAELARVAGHVPKWFTHPMMVTHPSTTQTQRRVISLSKTNALPYQNLIVQLYATPTSAVTQKWIFSPPPPPVYFSDGSVTCVCCCRVVLLGRIHVLLREALRVHDDSSDERAWQAGHVQQHRAHQRSAAESAVAGQQDGETVSPLAHHHLQLSSPRQQPTCRCLWSVIVGFIFSVLTLSFRVRMQSIIMSMFVSVSVILSAHITWKPCSQTSPNFLCVLYMAMACTCSGGIAVCLYLVLIR